MEDFKKLMDAALASLEADKAKELKKLNLMQRKVQDTGRTLRVQTEERDEVQGRVDLKRGNTTTKMIRGAFRNRIFLPKWQHLGDDDFGRG